MTKCEQLDLARLLVDANVREVGRGGRGEARRDRPAVALDRLERHAEAIELLGELRDALAAAGSALGLDVAVHDLEVVRIDLHLLAGVAQELLAHRLDGALDARTRGIRDDAAATQRRAGRARPYRSRRR